MIFPLRVRFMYEQRKEQLLPIRAFLWRVTQHIGMAILVVAGSLVGGMLGYVHFERLSWLDGFLNAAMILGGMRPVAVPQTPGGKLFAGVYALYSGMVFLVMCGIILAPAANRLAAYPRYRWRTLLGL